MSMTLSMGTLENHNFVWRYYTSRMEIYHYFEHWDGSEYYSQRCIDIASNRLTSRLVNQKSRFLGPGSALARNKINIDPDLIQKEDDGTFSVPSETKVDVSYSVDMELRICSCPHGRLKGPCKHRSQAHKWGRCGCIWELDVEHLLRKCTLMRNWFDADGRYTQNGYTWLR